MTTTSVTTSTTSQYTISAGNELLVNAGGNVSNDIIQSGGLLVVAGGVESGAIVSAGATETVSAGSASGDQIYGVLSNLSGAATHLTNEVIESGGKFYEVNSGVVVGAEVLSGGAMYVNGNTSGANSNTILSGGGLLELESAKATIGGTLTFEGGNNILAVSATVSAGYGDQAVISGFSTTDKIDAMATSSTPSFVPTSPTFTVSGGNTVVNVGGNESFIFSGTTTYTSANLIAVSDGAGGEYIEWTGPSAQGTSATVSAGQTSTGLTVSANETLTVQAGGFVVSTLVQSGGVEVVSGSDSASTVLSGGVETLAAGSASKDIISGSATIASGATVTSETVANGGSLTIASGGVDTNAIVSAGGTETVLGSATGDLVYGTLLTQASTSGVLTNETVEKGGVLTLANGNTASNTTVLSGGVFNISGADAGAYATVLSGGAVLDLQSPKAAIDGVLTFAGGGNTLEVASIASAPTTVSGVTTAYGDLAVISGFGITDAIDVTVVSAAGASLSFATSGGNEIVTISGASGSSTASEAFIFAGTSYNNFTLSIQPDIAGGAEIVYNPNATAYTVSSGVQSGLNVTSGETLTVLSGATVSATNVLSAGALIVSGSDIGASIATGATETVYWNASGDQIHGAVTVNSPAAVVSGETVLAGGSLAITAGSNHSATISAGGAETVTNSGFTSGDQIYGSLSVIGSSTVVSNETVLAGGSFSDNGAFNHSATISAGGSETVTNSGSTGNDQIFGSVTVNGGSAASETVQSGGLLFISAGTDTGTTILAGGNETVLGSATGDQIYGTQLVSSATAVVTNETVYAGGNLDVFLKGGIATGTTVLSGGALNISGFAYANNTVLNGGGVLSLQSPKAEITGSLTFENGGNTLQIIGTTSAGFGDQGIISGFSSTDVIDITSTAFAPGAFTIADSTSGGNTVAVVMSGGVAIETFTFAGVANLGLQSDGHGGEDVVLFPTSVTTPVTSATGAGAFEEHNTDTLLVENGGSVSAATIDDGGFLVVNGGVDFAANVLSGGLETISAGAASGDQIYGSAVVSGGVVSGETVLSGGALTVDGGVVLGATLSGGEMTVSGGAVSNIVLDGGATINLATPTALLFGTLTFANGGNTLEASAISNAGAGDLASIVGFSSSDKIDVAGISSTGASLSFASNFAGGDVATISGTGGSESFVFGNAATYNASTMSLISDGSGGVDLVLNTTPVVAFTSLGGETNKTSQIVNGTVNTALDPEAAGTIVTVSEGSTVLGTATVGANGYWSANVNLLNGSGANVLTASDTDAAKQTGATSQSLTYNVDTTAPAFIPGNLVVSIYGNGAGTGSYGLDQAAPIVLEQITTSGAYVGQIVLPETTTTVNGVTEYAISGEYGSASEGLLQLSADGHSLTIAGYGVNYQAFDASNATSVYGTNALGQTTSLSTATTTIVPRVIADINASGVIDTSTALENVDNSNNPRSVVTVDGTGFWLSGQGVKGDTTQGVFYAGDGSTTGTAINTATDTRVVEIYNGQLYVSADTTQGATNISSYGALPTSATAPVVLNAISNSVVLTAATANTANASAIGTSVNLSPESYYFANSTTLYVADSGLPKNGGVGDGGLQKWVDVGGTWTLQYTLSNGLNLVPNTDASGVSGLIGLTGQVVDGNVELYATSETVGELGQSYLYSITDQLTSTTGTGESFTTVMTAGADQIIRGVSFAPTETICFMAGTLVRTPEGETPVETLKRGDLVLTADGVAMPVTWLGKQTIAAAFADRVRSWPIRVKAGALDENVPCRDLLLSPDHALLVDGVLIHAGALVNGTSIVRETKVAPIFVYYHVELDDHSLILAENTPAETFIDNVERLNFDNWAEHEALYPNGKAIDELPLPRAKGRRQVPMQVRARLDARAQIIGETKAQAVA